MYQIVIVLKDSQTNIGLMFKSEGAAIATDQNIYDMRKREIDGCDSLIIAKDDYGHIARIMASAIIATVVADVEKEMLANEDRKMLDAQSQSRLQRRANSDPVLNLVAPGAKFQ